MLVSRLKLQFFARYGRTISAHKATKTTRILAPNVRSFRHFQRHLTSKSGNIDLIQDEFTRQAAVFEEKWNVRMKRGNEEIMDWVMGVIGDIPPGTKALDVASGTGIFARALAPFCESVTALDATDAMLAQAEKKSVEAGIQNITFQQGDAANMPFDEATFDLVVCRLCIHHFERPGTIVGEMARVCRHGGKVVIVDLTSVEEEEAAAQHNRIEILRDPSHTRAHSVPELCRLLEEVGGLKEVLDADKVPLLDVGMDLNAWMESTNTEESKRRDIVGSFEADLGGGVSTGMHAYRDQGGNICFKHRWATVVGVKK